MSSRDGARCERCGHEGPLRRPGLAPRLALAGVYVAFVVMLMGAALTGLGIVALGPLAVALAVLMQAPVAEAALSQLLSAEPALQGWRALGSTRVASGFYTSQAMRWGRG